MHIYIPLEPVLTRFEAGCGRSPELLSILDHPGKNPGLFTTPRSGLRSERRRRLYFDYLQISSAKGPSPTAYVLRGPSRRSGIDRRWNWSEVKQGFGNPSQFNIHKRNWTAFERVGDLFPASADKQTKNLKTALEKSESNWL